MIHDEPSASTRLLAEYDAQLRGPQETPSAISVTQLGPLRLVTFLGGRGFITYQHPSDEDGRTFRTLVPEALRHFESAPDIAEVEWKSRGHDHTLGLHETLIEHGFTAGEPESIMIGEARALAVDVELPEGVSLRQVADEAGVRAMSAMQDGVFGEPVSEENVSELLARLSRNDGMELWVAEADGVIVSAGRLEPVPNSDFAGIWGGSTLAQWRGRGIYRALTAARARSALAAGKTLINSDSTDYSRPILERSGFLAVSTTTPYGWKR